MASSNNLYYFSILFIVLYLCKQEVEYTIIVLQIFFVISHFMLIIYLLIKIKVLTNKLSIKDY